MIFSFHNTVFVKYLSLFSTLGYILTEYYIQELYDKIPCVKSIFLMECLLLHLLAVVFYYIGRCNHMGELRLCVQFFLTMNYVWPFIFYTFQESFKIDFFIRLGFFSSILSMFLDDSYFSIVALLLLNIPVPYQLFIILTGIRFFFDTYDNQQIEIEVREYKHSNSKPQKNDSYCLWKRIHRKVIPGAESQNV